MCDDKEKTNRLYSEHRTTIDARVDKKEVIEPHNCVGYLTEVSGLFGSEWKCKKCGKEYHSKDAPDPQTKLDDLGLEV